MNKHLASYLFSGESLFLLKEQGISLPKTEAPTTVSPKIETPAAPEVVSKPKSGDTVVITSDTHHRDFLEKIMSAVGVNMNDLHLMVGQEWKNFDLKAAQRLISFDVPIPKLDSSKKYQVFVVSGKKILIGDSLAQIQANQANEKRLLWNALKQMFELS